MTGAFTKHWLDCPRCGTTLNLNPDASLPRYFSCPSCPCVRHEDRVHAHRTNEALRRIDNLVEQAVCVMHNIDIRKIDHLSLLLHGFDDTIVTIKQQLLNDVT